VKPKTGVKAWVLGIIALVTVLPIACGTTATPTTQPANTPGATRAPTAASGLSVTGTPVPTVTAAPAMTPKPAGTVSAKDSITLVIASEPTTMNPFPGHAGAEVIVKHNMVDPFTWISGDDLQVVPTTATTGWEQRNNGWRFFLREGVKFHNGEEWNAQAAMPSLEHQGVGGNGNSSFGYTGAFTAEVVDDYTVDIICDPGCPTFPNTSVFMNFTAPDFYTNASEEELATRAVSFGPYKQVEWQPGVSVTMEAYDDYVPAGDHYEFQKPLIRTAKWLWRGEPTVLTAMIQGGEAAMAWDLGIDAIDILPSEQIKSGSQASMTAFHFNTLWHPELKKKKVRQAIAHAINCQDIVDSLYGGVPPCRGNILWPDVIGATERNIAPYEYTPELSMQLLAEANYDPSNEIKITGRADRIPKLTEVYEAMHGYMSAVGINAVINVVEPAIWNEGRQCAIGKAVNEVLEAQGKDPSVAKPTLADMQAALDKGGANCPTSDMVENAGLSSETLDFGRNATNYLNCVRPASYVCDPSPGGLQEQLGPALAASGEERQRRLAALADRIHDDVLLLSLFEPPVIYGVDSKLNWTPRFDMRVRVNTMWFSK
jgi:peptide/nickel transport system substrate-binding protein